MARLPKQVDGIGRTDTLTVGAKKALSAFIDEYGSAEGQRIYKAKADEKGRGTTLRQKVNSVYRTGAKIQ